MIKVDDSGMMGKIAKLALLTRKGVEETARQIAGRFIRTAVRNTPPMIIRITPTQAKREWATRVTANYENKPYVKGRWLSRREMRRILKEKERQLGREAAGWNAAAQQLNATVPAWVKRHSGEGSCLIRRSGTHLVISVTNSVPYNEEMTRRRAQFALSKTEAGLDGNLRVLKRRLLRSLR